MASNLHDVRRRQFKLKLTMLTKEILELLLKHLDCDSNYRVDYTGSKLVLRESSQHPPSETQKRHVDKLLSKLQEKDVLDYVEGFSNVRVTRDISVITPSKIITAVNPQKLLSLLGVQKEKPDHLNVDEKTWALIPDEIKDRWDRFSGSMQKHIINCVSENLEEKFKQLVTTRVFGESMRSPISFGVPRIPVRLPNPLLARGVSNELYDLHDILQIRERSPSNPALRRDPITRAYFSLDQVVPDTEALENIKKRAQDEQAPGITPP